eukprot:scaffold33503_cov48-Phaeocystis_antarctica.AAC.3
MSSASLSLNPARSARLENGPQNERFGGGGVSMLHCATPTSALGATPRRLAAVTGGAMAEVDVLALQAAPVAALAFLRAP